MNRTLVSILFAAASLGCFTLDSYSAEASYAAAPIMQKETAAEILEERGVNVSLHMSIYAVKLISKEVSGLIVADAKGTHVWASCDLKTLKAIGAYRHLWVAFTSDEDKKGHFYFRAIEPKPDGSSLSKFHPEELRDMNPIKK